MKRFFRPFQVCVVALLASLLSCSGPLSTTGGGTETVNTFAMLSDGTPANGATVQIIDAGGWLDSVRTGASPIIETVTSDKDGRIVLKKRDNDSSINIQIDHISQGLFSSYVNIGMLDNDTLRLVPYASYSGTFDSSANALGLMLLSGSAYRASVSNGSFVFNNIAPAPFAVLGTNAMSLSPQIATSGAVTLNAGTASADTGLNASFDRLLVDNFENGVGPSFLAKIFPCVLGWYVVSESGKLEWNSSSTILVWTPFPNQDTSGTCHSFIDMVQSPGAGSASALEFSTALDSACSNPYATAGIGFRGCNTNGIDLSSMKSFSLRTRGNGIVWVRFETKTLDTVTNKVSNYSFPIVLTDSWQSLRVPVDSLRILPAIQAPAQHPWAQESKNVIDIEFEFSKSVNALGDTLHMFLDDFYLDGVGIDVLGQ